MYRPDTVVIGAQRAGTTMLLSALAEHPEVEAFLGEYHGFSDPVYAPDTAETISRSFRRADARRRVFKCASYLAQPEVPKRLANDLDMPEIVVALRDPVQRAVSAWYWYVYVGLIPLESHETGLARLLGGQTEGVEWRHGDEILEWGLYNGLLEKWLSVFPREKVHVLTDLELHQDTDGALRSLYRALGLDPAHEPISPAHPHNRGVYSLIRLRWLRRRNRLTWRESEGGRWFPARPDELWPSLAHAGIHLVDRSLLALLERTGPPRLSPALELDLWRYYEDDVKQLEERLGIDLSGWRRSSPPSELTLSRAEPAVEISDAW